LIRILSSRKLSSLVVKTTRSLRQQSVTPFLALFIAVTCAGCAVTRPPLVYENGVAYGRTRGAWRDRWWNYYEAGRDYSKVDSGLEYAVLCFRGAIARRSRDQYGARTYGVHFLEEYFPHRELGITLFRLGDFDGAIRELALSRSQTDSARARYYLNRARGLRLQALDLDLGPPTIAIVSPTGSGPTADFSIVLSGTARDDRGVAGLIVNGKPQDLELAQKEVHFSVRVPLASGPNVLNVNAEDLVSKRTQVTATVIADWDGPVVAISEPLADAVVTEPSVSVRGTLLDATGVSLLEINGRDVPIHGAPGSKQVDFVDEIMLERGRNTISLVAVDRVGNTTSSELTVFFRHRDSVVMRAFPRNKNRIMLAMAGDHIPIHRDFFTSTAHAEGNRMMFAQAPGESPDTEPVRIVLADLREYQSTYYSWARVSGTAEGAKPIKTVQVNDRPLVTASLDKQRVDFNLKLPLEVGENEITVGAVDVDNRLAMKTVRIERKEPELAALRYRMALAVPRFIEIGEVDPSLSELAYTLLNQAFVQGGRFHMPVRGTDLEPVLDELALSATIFVDPETVQRTGRLVGADAVLLVSITEEWNDEVTILTRLINTETGTYMAEDTMPDIFAAGKSMEVLQEKLQILADRYAVAFPLLKGKVAAIRGDDVITNVGRDEGLKAQMKFHVYKELGTIVDPETGEEICPDVDVLTQAFIHEVYENGSRAEVIKPERLEDIAPGDSVMTK